MKRVGGKWVKRDGGWGKEGGGQWKKMRARATHNGGTIKVLDMERSASVLQPAG